MDSVITNVEDVFQCTYNVNFPVVFNKEIKIEQSSILLENYSNSQYLISPRFIFRNLSSYNLSSMIKNYNINIISTEKKNLKNGKFTRLSTKEAMETNDDLSS